jgi:sterol desaturase/sphingolipid hydroxylase (fatty acid hydroxylase superfamily)
MFSELMQIQIVVAAIVVSWAVFVIILERKYPYNPGQKFFRDGFFNDFVMYNAVQSIILGIIISWLIDLIDSSTGLSRSNLIGNWPIWLQVVFFVFTHDLYIYLFHRFMHHNKYLWRLHEAHHTPKQIDWIAGARSHPIEILVNQSIEFMPIILLGAAPEVAVIKGGISGIWGMWIHSNINVRTGWLQYIINGPEMHRWHHVDETYEAYNMNFATKFAFWDWIFKTAYFPDPKKVKAEKYGLGDLPFPKNYFQQTIFAFRKFGKWES